MDAQASVRAKRAEDRQGMRVMSPHLFLKNTKEEIIMKVYLVTNYYCDDRVEGIFSSREKGLEFVKSLEEENFGRYFVDEREVQ